MARDIEPQEQSETTDLILGDERLFQEINLLRIEGFAFCFAPKAAGTRVAKQDFLELVRMPEGNITRPITIEPHPTYGMPSVQSYKVLQAALKKLSDEGYEGAESIAFSQRELGKLIGRKSFGGNTSRQLLGAIMALRYTGIWCSFYDKDTKEWRVVNFSIFIDALFSGKKTQIKECVLTFHPRIVSSLKNRHYVCLNYNRLSQLEPIGMALYKQLFFNMSRLHQKLGKNSFVYERDYASICTTWLGGLKVLGYRAKILQEQLGSHLEGLKKVRLVKSFDIVKTGEGGFKLVIVPGAGFFEDYDRYYSKNRQLPIPFARVSEEHTISKPLKLLSYFHKRRLGVEELAEQIYSEKEAAFARTLVQKYTEELCHEIVDFALEKARDQKFNPQTLSGIGQYVNEFFATKSERDRRAAERLVREKVRREEETIERQKAAYDLFYKMEIKRAREGLSARQLEALEAPLREKFNAKYPGVKGGLAMLIWFEGNTVLQKRFKIPTFEEWRAKGQPKARGL